MLVLQLHTEGHSMTILVDWPNLPRSTARLTEVSPFEAQREIVMKLEEFKKTCASVSINQKVMPKRPAYILENGDTLRQNGNSDMIENATE
jgi:hypothetical protein